MEYTPCSQLADFEVTTSGVCNTKNFVEKHGNDNLMYASTAYMPPEYIDNVKKIPNPLPSYDIYSFGECIIV